MKRVLFLCTGNSCRSQMAEGWLRHLAGDRFEAMSAGTHPQGLNPLAVETMKEYGIDISGQQSKSVDQYGHIPFDVVVTVCDQARQACPTIPKSLRVIHWSFPDPAATEGTLEKRTATFRHIRDEIKIRLEGFIEDCS